jgi:hypothetical protein
VYRRSCGALIARLRLRRSAARDPALGAQTRLTIRLIGLDLNRETIRIAQAVTALQRFGNIYSRIMNPTIAVFEERIAALD